MNVPQEQPDSPRGDRGHDKTWEPPQGEQGISNRENDEENAPADEQRRS